MHIWVYWLPAKQLQKKDQKEKNLSSWSTCKTTPVGLRELRGSWPCHCKWCLSRGFCVGVSAQQRRELQGGFQAPEATKRWLSTSRAGDVSASLHLLPHVLTTGTQNASPLTLTCAYVDMMTENQSARWTRRPNPQQRTTWRTKVKVKYSSGYWFR